MTTELYIRWPLSTSSLSPMVASNATPVTLSRLPQDSMEAAFSGVKRQTLTIEGEATDCLAGLKAREPTWLIWIIVVRELRFESSIAGDNPITSGQDEFLCSHGSLPDRALFSIEFDNAMLTGFPCRPDIVGSKGWFPTLFEGVDGLQKLETDEIITSHGQQVFVCYANTANQLRECSDGTQFSSSCGVSSMLSCGLVRLE